MTSPFETAFGTKPAASASAPARANLLGEHTDYNDGFVLPTPLAFTTTVEAAIAKEPGVITAYATLFKETKFRTFGTSKQGDWLDYVAGCVEQLRLRGVDLPGLTFAVDGNVPMGAGISSSASLEVATLRALRALLKLDLDDVEIARIARAAEADYVGMPCGIMDQMVSSLGTPGQVLFLDTRTLERRLLPLPKGHTIMVVHSGVSHQLVDGGYKQRVEECRAASAALGVAWLRDLTMDDLPRVNALPEPLNRRARHQLTENRRVLDALAALEKGDAAAFGQLMTGSHASQRDDYKVSVPAVDTLVEAALRHGALGARLTGGGFGGSIVALVEDGKVAAWKAAVVADCPACRPL
jgi:galactokinase